MNDLIQKGFGYRFWGVPWQADVDRLMDVYGETIAEFFTERCHQWRNPKFPSVMEEGGNETGWRLYAALTLTIAPIWQAAIECVHGRLTPREFRLAAHAELKQVAQNGLDDWERLLNIPYAPWRAKGRNVYNSLGMPIASVRAFVVRTPSRLKNVDDNPEIVLAAQRLARIIAALPNTLYSVRHVVHGDPSDIEIKQHCVSLYEIMLGCINDCMDEKQVVSRDTMEGTQFVMTR